MTGAWPTATKTTQGDDVIARLAGRAKRRSSGSQGFLVGRGAQDLQRPQRASTTSGSACGAIEALEARIATLEKEVASLKRARKTPAA